MKVFAYLTGLTGGAALLALGQALWSHDFSQMRWFSLLVVVVHTVFGVTSAAKATLGEE